MKRRRGKEREGEGSAGDRREEERIGEEGRRGKGRGEEGRGGREGREGKEGRGGEGFILRTWLVILRLWQASKANGLVLLWVYRPEHS